MLMHNNQVAQATAAAAAAAAAAGRLPPGYERNSQGTVMSSVLSHLNHAPSLHAIIYLTHAIVPLIFRLVLTQAPLTPSLSCTLDNIYSNSKSNPS